MENFRQVENPSIDETSDSGLNPAEKNLSEKKSVVLPTPIHNPITATESTTEELAPESSEDAEQGSIVEVETSEEDIVLEDKPESNTSATKTYSALPTRIDSDPKILKVGFITDLHIKTYLLPDSSRDINPKYKDKIYYFNSQMANKFAPDFIVVNGDSIEGTGRPVEQGIQELQLCKNQFDLTGIPKYWNLGNHELRSVNKSQWQTALGQADTKRAFVNGDFLVVMVDSNFYGNDEEVAPGREFIRGNVSEKELNWLEGVLKSNDDKLKVVFIHHPPLTLLDKKPSGKLLYNAQKLQNVFEKYGVKAVFSGHIERLIHQKINGVNYYVLPGLAKHETYEGAFSTIEMEKGKKTKVELTYIENNGEYKTVEVK